ncbi:MarR family winged helix-turn-helix transcriptional regulator [Curtobacterium sp. ISL-83]|uniref:MarR family winged helix-turn-helix transcriptional regulator n=1 Tax=Curtobacterium sp. ISL-83 TaxID=2819145 RepID=UPI001BE5E201|nr:MarR family transcriptional regulator [Curtobacterium sp. ISL-83]MBT2504265.1 MarR family transcriptional regulator [Curtobacterium sp. ISL-83]
MTDIIATPDSTATGEEAPIVRLMSAFRTLQGHHTRILRRESSARGMNPTDLRLVFFLSSNDGATSKQAGEYLELSTGAMTSLVDRLEEHGHIERRRNPQDRRSSLLFLTPSGAAVATDIGSVYGNAFRETIPDEQVLAVAQLFEQIGSALR